MLIRKLLVRLLGVGTNADDFRTSLLKGLITISERACLSGTASRIIFRIEVEYDILFAKKTLPSLTGSPVSDGRVKSGARSPTFTPLLADRD